MTTTFQLFRNTAVGLSTITKTIDGDLTVEQVRQAVNADQHCRELMQAGWWLDEWSIRHYVMTNQPIDTTL